MKRGSGVLLDSYELSSDLVYRMYDSAVYTMRTTVEEGEVLFIVEEWAVRLKGKPMSKAVEWDLSDKAREEIHRKLRERGASARDVRMVAEWHTHPGYPSPSIHDLQFGRTLSEFTRKMGVSAPIFLLTCGAVTTGQYAVLLVLKEKPTTSYARAIDELIAIDNLALLHKGATVEARRWAGVKKIEAVRRHFEATLYRLEGGRGEVMPFDELYRLISEGWFRDDC